YIRIIVCGTDARFNNDVIDGSEKSEIDEHHQRDDFKLGRCTEICLLLHIFTDRPDDFNETLDIVIADRPSVDGNSFVEHFYIGRGECALTIIIVIQLISHVLDDGAFAVFLDYFYSVDIFLRITDYSKYQDYLSDSWFYS